MEKEKEGSKRAQQAGTQRKKDKGPWMNNLNVATNTNTFPIPPSTAIIYLVLCMHPIIGEQPSLGERRGGQKTEGQPGMGNSKTTTGEPQEESKA